MRGCCAPAWQLRDRAPPLASGPSQDRGTRSPQRRRDAERRIDECRVTNRGRNRSHRGPEDDGREEGVGIMQSARADIVPFTGRVCPSWVVAALWGTSVHQHTHARDRRVRRCGPHPGSCAQRAPGSPPLSLSRRGVSLRALVGYGGHPHPRLTAFGTPAPHPRSGGHRRYCRFCLWPDATAMFRSPAGDSMPFMGSSCPPGYCVAAGHPAGRGCPSGVQCALHG